MTGDDAPRSKLASLKDLFPALPDLSVLSHAMKITLSSPPLPSTHPADKTGAHLHSQPRYAVPGTLFKFGFEFLAQAT